MSGFRNLTEQQLADAERLTLQKIAEARSVWHRQNAERAMGAIRKERARRDRLKASESR